MDFEFRPEEIRSLKDMASVTSIPEVEIKSVYDRVIQRATASGRKPDSSFIVKFVQRSSFMQKSSYREKLLTLLGALQNSLSWSTQLPGKSRNFGAGLKERARRSLVENYRQERAMNLQRTAVVVDEAEPAEPVHEEADSRAGSPDDFSQGLLADLRNH